jgi:hypothetical protein
MSSLKGRVQTRFEQHLTPERTRRATRLEQYTVQRLSWDLLVRLNRWLEVTGWTATAAWVVFMGTVLFGVHWKEVVEDAVNSGKPIGAAITLAITFVTLVFVAIRSVIGFVRWRIQRELWRRDVAGR